MDAAPFRALRYNPAVAGEPASTSAPAYDDLDPSIYARHRTASPYTVLELLTRNGDYERAGGALRRWLRTGVLTEDTEPAFYLYEEHELRHGVPTVQQGLLAAVAFDDDAVLAHEQVDPARVGDRKSRLEAVPVDLAPVFAVFAEGGEPLRRLLERRPASPPVARLTDEAGIDHRVWRIAAEFSPQIRAALADVRVVIADGHHRYAAAAALEASSGGRILMYLVDALQHGPQVLPVHRVIRDGGGRVPDAWDDLVEVVDAPLDPRGLLRVLERQTGRAWGLRLAHGRSCLLLARDEEQLQQLLPAQRSPAWRDLDTAVFGHALLPRLGDAELAYATDIRAGIAAVEASERDALVVFRPAPVEAVYACAVARDPMPPKTTWFRPKPRAGLIMRSLHSAE